MAIFKIVQRSKQKPVPICQYNLQTYSHHLDHHLLSGEKFSSFCRRQQRDSTE